MDVLSLLFPKKCVGCKKIGDYICAGCFGQISFETSHICAVCGHPGVDGVTHPRCLGRYTIDGASAALIYKGIVKKLIYQYKFSPHLFDMTSLLGDLFYEALIENEQLQEYLKDSVIISVPLSKKRMRIRGYNQSELLSKYLASKLALRYIDISYRVVDNVSQVGKTAKERRENVKGIFALKGKIDFEKAIVVDDILTSGATMSELARLLKRNGVKKVWGLALAHGE